MSSEHFLEFLWIAFHGDHDESRFRATAEQVARSGLTVSTLLHDAVLFQRALREGDTFLGSSDMELPRRYFGEAGVSDLRAVRKNFETFPEDWQKLLTAEISFALKFLVALDEAGAGIVAGTDSRTAHLVPGFALHDELALFTRAGLSPYRALRAATVNPAALLGISHGKGTVEEGKVADLILLRGNPLSSLDAIRDPLGVMVRGRWLDATDLTELRRP